MDDFSTKSVDILIIVLVIWVIRVLLSRCRFGVQWTIIIRRWKVSLDNDAVSTKSVVILIIVLGVWVIRVGGNLGCNGRP